MFDATYALNVKAPFFLTGASSDEASYVNCAVVAVDGGRTDV